jgi:hypothetical protein
MPEFVRGSDGRIYEIRDSGDGAGVFAVMSIAAMMAAYNAYLWVLSHYVAVGWITLFGFITWVGWVYHEYQEGEGSQALGKKIGSFLLILLGFTLTTQGYFSSREQKDPVQQPVTQPLPTTPVRQQTGVNRKTTQPVPENTTAVTQPVKPVAPSTSEPAPPNPSTGYVKTQQGSPLRLRALPSDTARTVVMIPNGAAVTILGYDKNEVVIKGERGRWCNIKFWKDEGWAWGNFIVPNK